MRESAPYTIRDPERAAGVAVIAGMPGVFGLCLLAVLVTHSYEGSPAGCVSGIAVCAALVIALVFVARAVSRACVRADPGADGIVIRYTFRRRRVPWTDVEGFDIRKGGPLRFRQVYLLRTGGRPLRLSPLPYRRAERGRRQPQWELENEALLTEWLAQYRQRTG